MLSRDVAMEISEAVDEHRQVIARLEGDLAARRQKEARELAELQGQVAAMNGRKSALEKRSATATAQQNALTAELARLEDGLSRERRAWVRVAVPTVASLLLLVALMSIGLSGGRSWWWVLLLGGVGFAAGKRWGRPRE